MEYVYQHFFLAWVILFNGCFCGNFSDKAFSELDLTLMELNFLLVYIILIFFNSKKDKVIRRRSQFLTQSGICLRSVLFNLVLSGLTAFLYILIFFLVAKD